jgi:hypothetical protein
MPGAIRRPGPASKEAVVISLRRALPPIAVALAIILPTGAAQASGRAAKPLCLPVNATGVGQDLGGGMTTATIFSHGLRLGTTHASFTITGVTGTTASFIGPIVFTTLPGTLTAQVAGTLNVATGAFSATSSSVTGTGLLARISGSLTFNGNENLATGSFTETITGRLCGGGL